MYSLIIFTFILCFSLVSAESIDKIATYNEEPKIVFISGHYPLNTYFAEQTRKSFEDYTSKHGYGFYYEESDPLETEPHALHFRRCEIISKAFIKYPFATWFVWVDSDVYVNRPTLTLESQIDLSDTNILYHLFHERPWSYPINTGVKIVNREAIKWEEEVWSLRNTPPWNEFPFEQKTIAEHILPQIPGKYLIHDPYILNCIKKLYPKMVKKALFVHMCATSTEERNRLMRERELEQTRLIKKRH